MCCVLEGRRGEENFVTGTVVKEKVERGGEEGNRGVLCVVGGMVLREGLVLVEEGGKEGVQEGRKVTRGVLCVAGGGRSGGVSASGWSLPQSSPSAPVASPGDGGLGSSVLLLPSLLTTFRPSTPPPSTSSTALEQRSSTEGGLSYRLCPVCQKRITYNHLKRHIRTQHTQMDRAQCPFCARVLKNTYSLETHIANYHK